jgi:hypothetical protein
MNALHPNIHAIRHPNFTPITWSHHQKFGSHRSSSLLEDLTFNPFPMWPPSQHTLTLFFALLLLLPLRMRSLLAVVIDEEVAFVGGVDLCYNRYDDSRYLLADHDASVFPGRYKSFLYAF